MKLTVLIILLLEAYPAFRLEHGYLWYPTYDKRTGYYKHNTDNKHSTGRWCKRFADSDSRHTPPYDVQEWKGSTKAC